MNYQPKVNTTQQYSDSQGEHIVCKGKLVLIEIDSESNSLLTKSSIGIISKREGDIIYDPTGLDPIIISETEEIEVGDWCINNMVGEDHKDYMKIFQFKDHMYIGTNKILALPEHFSDKHLQAITDGKMKDGDEVLVKCKYNGLKHGYSTPLVDVWKVYLNKQNHITLFPAKQSLEEALKVHDYGSGESSEEWAFQCGFKAGAEWAKKNNYKGE